MLKKLLSTLVIIDLWIPTSANELYVASDRYTGFSCPSQPCATLSQYLQDNNGTLPVVSNVTYYLLPGILDVPKHMVLTGLYNVTFVGITDYVVLYNCGLNSFIHIVNSIQISFKRITFQQCPLPQVSPRNYNKDTNLKLTLCVSCTIHNVNFLEYGLMATNLIGDSYITNVSINLTNPNPTSYMRYHALILHYNNLNSAAYLKHSLFISNISVTGHGNKCLPDHHTDHYAFEIRLKQIEYSIKFICIMHCFMKWIRE